jgi:ATP-dependent RNA helicase DBP3
VWVTHYVSRRPSLTLIPVSATWPESVRQLANSYMQDPVRIVVGSDDLSANQRIEQVVDVFDDPREKE